MTYEVELGVQPQAFDFIHIKVVGDSIEEIEYKLANEMSQLANVSAAAWSTARALVDLTVGGLGGTVESPVAGAAPAPTKPWEKAATAAPATSAKPWEKAAPAAAAPAAPASGNTFRVKFPYEDDAARAAERKEFLGGFYAQFKNSLAFDKAEKLYKFNRQPGAPELELLAQGMDYFGGEIISE
jgi:hypothetical protein